MLNIINIGGDLAYEPVSGIGVSLGNKKTKNLK